MKKFKMVYILSLILFINYILMSQNTVFADSLIYVLKDYNKSSNYLNLYVNDIDSPITDISATIDGQDCEVNYYNLESNYVDNDIYFLISVSNFDGTISTEKEDKTNKQINNLLTYLFKNKSQDSTYHFNLGMLGGKTINFSSVKDIQNTKYTLLNCALNMCLEDILISIENKHTPSKIVIISDGTNDANPTITSNDILNTLDRIPCEIIPIKIELLSPEDTFIDDINSYNLTGAKNFNLSSEYEDILNQINDWSNIGIFEVNLNNIPNDADKTLHLTFKDNNETVSIEYSLKLLTTTDIEDTTVNLKKYVIISLLIILLITIIFLIISINNQKTPKH